MEEDNGNRNDNDNGNNIFEEEEAILRRNQVLLFGVILLGIFAICLAVSMPQDLEFNNSEIPTADDPMAAENIEIPISLLVQVTNLTNSSRKSYFKNPEDSVENKIMRNIAIHKTIKGLEKTLPTKETFAKVKSHENNDNEKINQIVKSFMDTEEFEEFIIDVEITDAIKRLRRERGYKKRESTIFDDLFKQIERHFLGDNPNEVHLIKRVGEELERRARETLKERRKSRQQNEDEGDLIANEIYNDYSVISDENVVYDEEDENGD